jgi:hypothetical protein
LTRVSLDLQASRPTLDQFPGEWKNLHFVSRERRDLLRMERTAVSVHPIG